MLQHRSLNISKINAFVVDLILQMRMFLQRCCKFYKCRCFTIKDISEYLYNQYSLMVDTQDYCQQFSI